MGVHNNPIHGGPPEGRHLTVPPAWASSLIQKKILHPYSKPHHSNRDDMKALKCTLQELQGIDPLDYLAKYCIIDQEKLPHYRRVYDNVDRDEDDEIGISELDFALKAVNYELISDAEMRYVHSVSAQVVATRHVHTFVLTLVLCTKLTPPCTYVHTHHQPM